MNSLGHSERFLALPKGCDTANLPATGRILACLTGYQKQFPPYFNFADDFVRIAMTKTDSA